MRYRSAARDKRDGALLAALVLPWIAFSTKIPMA
jgi:hypothetical protein